jgi:hypothetical protein
MERKIFCEHMGSCASRLLSLWNADTSQRRDGHASRAKAQGCWNSAAPQRFDIHAREECAMNPAPKWSFLLALLLIFASSWSVAAADRGFENAFKRVHPSSGGEAGGFWGGWKGLADGSVPPSEWDNRADLYGVYRNGVRPRYDHRRW